MRAIWAAALLLGIAVSLPAQNTNHNPDPNWVAPAKAAARPNPLPHSPDVVAGGKKLFGRNCTTCHGETGAGAIPGAANLTLPAVQGETDGALFWKITNGNPRRAMPSFSGLPELQRWQLVLYIRELGNSKSESLNH